MLAERVRWQLDGWLTHAAGPTGGLTLLRLAPEEQAPQAAQSSEPVERRRVQVHGFDAADLP